MKLTAYSYKNGMTVTYSDMLKYHEAPGVVTGHGRALSACQSCLTKMATTTRNGHAFDKHL